MKFCKYKNIFGEPGKGVHKYRLFGFAFLDIFLSVVLAVLISYKFKINLLKCLVGVLVVGVFSHWIFCVDTKLNEILGLTGV